MNDDDIARALRSAGAPRPAATGIDPHVIARHGRRRRLRIRAAAVLGAAAVVAGSVSAYAVIGTRGPGALPPVSPAIAGVPLSELTVDGMTPKPCEGAPSLTALAASGRSVHCGPAMYADGRSAENFEGSYVDRGDHLDIPYIVDTHQCGFVGAPVMKVYENATSVDILRLTALPAPVVTPKPGEIATGCTDSAQSGVLHVPLRSPLAGRTVRNIGYLPPRPILDPAQAAAEQHAENAAVRSAHRLCRSADVRLGKHVDTAYPTDVATVRADFAKARSPWGFLPGTQPAAQCYLNNGRGHLIAALATAGVAPVVYDTDYTSNLRARLPAIAGHPQVD